jgi:hypothetical protein
VFSNGVFQALLPKRKSLAVRYAVETAVDSFLFHMVPHHFATGLVAPSPTTEFSTASWQDGAKRVVFPCDFLIVKLRSFRCTMPVEAEVGSLVRHMVSHHFATGLVAPSPTTEFSTASLENGAKRVALPRDFLLPSCDLSVCGCQPTRQWPVMFVTWYRITLLLELLLHVPPPCFPQQSKVDQIYRDFTCCFQAVFPKGDLALGAMAFETNVDIFVIAWSHIILLLESLLLHLPPIRFPPPTKMERMSRGSAWLPGLVAARRCVAVGVRTRKGHGQSSRSTCTTDFSHWSCCSISHPPVLLNH